MKNLIIIILSSLLIASIGCQNEDGMKKPNNDQQIVPRHCPGDWIEIGLQKGKCKNDCTRGLSVRCGGYIAKMRCGVFTINFPECGAAYTESGDWELMPAMADQDTSSAIDVKIVFPDRYHARFIYLEDISSELAYDSDLTISNNVRWVDDDGFTFGAQVFHYFQFIGGDYPITTSYTYPYGTALVDMNSY